MLHLLITRHWRPPSVEEEAYKSMSSRCLQLSLLHNIYEGVYYLLIARKGKWIRRKLAYKCEDRRYEWANLRYAIDKTIGLCVLSRQCMPIAHRYTRRRISCTCGPCKRQYSVLVLPTSEWNKSECLISFSVSRVEPGFSIISRFLATDD